MNQSKPRWMPTTSSWVFFLLLLLHLLSINLAILVTDAATGSNFIVNMLNCSGRKLIDRWREAMCTLHSLHRINRNSCIQLLKLFPSAETTEETILHLWGFRPSRQRLSMYVYFLPFETIWVWELYQIATFSGMLQLLSMKWRHCMNYLRSWAVRLLMMDLYTRYLELFFHFFLSRPRVCVVVTEFSSVICSVAMIFCMDRECV